MSNLNRERLIRKESFQCLLTHDQLDCAFQECDSRPVGALCPILEKVKRDVVNAQIKAGVRGVYSLLQNTCSNCGADTRREFLTTGKPHLCNAYKLKGD